MAKTKLDKKTSELLVSLVADSKVWKEEQKKSFKNIAKDISVKGFRKGNVPHDILKKHISQNDIFEGALRKMIDLLAGEASKEIKEDIMVLDAPSYKIDKISDTDLELTFIYPIYPEIELSNYKELDIKFEIPKLDKKVIEDELVRIQNMQATLELKDGPIEKGDTAVFDFDGTVDGESFEGGTSENYSLEIGSGQFIPGFEDQMVGMKSGDKKEIKVTFPKEYHADSLKGKEAVFSIEVKEVKIKKLPELNKEFVKSVGVNEVETLEELKKYIEKVFKEQENQRARSTFQKEAFGKIIEKTEISLPGQLVAKEMKNQENKFAEKMKQQGLSIEKYVEMTGIKIETLNSQFKEEAENNLKESLIFAEISKLEKIQLEDKDYDNEYIKLSKVYGQDVESIKNVITKEQMQIPMTNDRVIDLLIKYNK